MGKKLQLDAITQIEGELETKCEASTRCQQRGETIRAAPKPPEINIPKGANKRDDPIDRALQQTQKERKSLRYTRLPNRALTVDPQGICSKPPQKRSPQGTNASPRPTCPRVIAPASGNSRRRPFGDDGKRGPRVGENVESASGASLGFTIDLVVTWGGAIT